MEKVVGKNFEQVSPDKGEFLTVILSGIISLSLFLPLTLSDSFVVTETTSILRIRSLLLLLNGL